MREAAIRVQGLGKAYRLGHAADPHASFREALMRGLTSPFRRLRGRRREAPDETFWALRDVSFEVRPGEVVGIIGRNGAGKSTLLKMLSRITEPTTGYAEIDGRVASLLEVGTGFHAELTGRENIYLNGAILGMKKSEIDAKFDEIVAFAGVERFLDTPVKRYSSGMYVRLAFAVAAHLEPEILIVDEVLAVGDVAFQRKCLGRMQQFAEGSGRTVLFVSHNLASLRALCTHGMLLQEGRLAFHGTIESAVQAYIQTLEEQTTDDLSQVTARRGEGRVRLERIGVTCGEHPGTRVSAGGSVRLEIHASGWVPDLRCRVVVYDSLGYALAAFDSPRDGTAGRGRSSSAPRFVCEIDEFLFVPGRYRLNVAVFGDDALQDHIEGAAFIDVVPGIVRGQPSPAEGAQTRVLIPHRWIAAGGNGAVAEDHASVGVRGASR